MTQQLQFYGNLNGNIKFNSIILIVKLLKNLTKCYMQNLGRKCHKLLTELSHPHSVYFMKGNDSRLLNQTQQNQIAEIVNDNSLTTSCLLFNPIEATRKLNAWYQKLPWIKPHYAIKANPATQLLKNFTDQGAGLDCASRTELQAALNLGLKPNEIVYSNPIKDQSDLEWAYQNKISLTTADSMDQLYKIQRIAPKMRILWRISIKEEASDKLATPFSGKFGDDLESDAKIHSRMREIADSGVNLKGIHFHCGSGHHGSSAFGKAVLFARNCLKIGRQYGHQMNTLDIGGGFPSGELSQKTIDALSVTKNDPLEYNVMAEPGRHFSGNSFYLLTRVLGKRLKNNRTCYHLNESLYHSFNCNLMDGVTFENSTDQFYSKLEHLQQNPLTTLQTQNSTLFGMTCDGMDIITKNIAVPNALKVGDWICVSGMGAYTYGCRSNFNGMFSTEKIITWPTNVQKEPRNVPEEVYIPKPMTVYA